MGPERDSLNRRDLLGGALVVASAVALPAQAKVGKDLAGFKCTEFIRRGPGLSREQFADHWRAVRGPLVRQLPGLTKLAFNVTDEAHTPNAPYDGAVEYWFADAAAYDHAFNGANDGLSEKLTADAKLFMQPDFLGMFTHEVEIHPLKPGIPAPKFKRMGLVRRTADVSRADFMAGWREKHSLLADLGYGIQRYVLNLIERDRMPDCPWDGYAEFWWESWADMERASRDRPPAQLAEKSPFGDTLLLRLVED